MLNLVNRILICFFVVAICSGSYGHRLQDIFSRAEALMHEAPEESLKLLESISLSDIKNAQKRARYALLMSQALDKNYIDVCSDSLIQIAVEYYDETKDHHNRMLAFYYEGIVLLNSGDYTKSAIYFEKAVEEASVLKDFFYLGLANRALSRIMNETKNFTQALIYDKNAINYFINCEKELYEQYQWLAFAINCFNDGQYSKAIYTSDSLISVIESPTLRGRFELVKAGSLIETRDDDYELPISIFKRVDKNLFYQTDFGYYAYALDKIGARDSSDFYLRSAFSISNNHIDSTAVQVYQARIENNRGNYKKAYALLSNALEVQDSLTKNLLAQSVSVAQKDFFNKEVQYQRVKVKNARLTIALISSISISLFVVGILMYLIRKRKYDEKIKEQLTQLAIEKQYSGRLATDNAHLIGSLFSERLGHIDRLAYDYMVAETPEEKERIFKNYKKNYEALKKDTQIFISLESDLDRYCNGIMQKLRAEIPTIKGKHLSTIALFFAGIPIISIQIITEKQSRKAVEVERSRYKKIIQESGAEHTNLFLEMLYQKKRQIGV